MKMKAKLIVDEQELEVEILEEDFKKLEEKLMKKIIKTGYERTMGQKYYYVDIDGDVTWDTDQSDQMDEGLYNLANYYSDSVVADNNARADRLMYQLRRFAVEHRGEKLDWYNDDQPKYFIGYNYVDDQLEVEFDDYFRRAFVIYFYTYKSAMMAIDIFRDDLVWYFTEYKDSV